MNNDKILHVKSEELRPDTELKLPLLNFKVNQKFLIYNLVMLIAILLSWYFTGVFSRYGKQMILLYAAIFILFVIIYQVYKLNVGGFGNIDYENIRINETISFAGSLVAGIALYIALKKFNPFKINPTCNKLLLLSLTSLVFVNYYFTDRITDGQHINTDRMRKQVFLTYGVLIFVSTNFLIMHDNL